MESEKTVILEQALGDYIKIAGTPQFIESGSDYGLMEKVFREFNQHLRRKYTGALEGKHVIPLTSQ